MFIERLSIVSSLNDTVIRNINFHSGANFIVDKEDSTRHNHVGKTTFLKLIDVALGSKDKQFIYRDLETENPGIELHGFINSQKIFIELVLIDSFTINNAERLMLKTELFDGGKRFINGQETKSVEYNKILNAKLFDNFENVPSFRNLIKSFVRISVKNDNQAFLHSLYPTATIPQYRSLYNFLFEISDPKIDETKGHLSTELRSVKKAKNKYQQLNNIEQDINVIEQVLVQLRKDQNSLQMKISDLINGIQFEENRSKIEKIRKEYTELTRDISELQFQKKMADTKVQELSSNAHSENLDRISSQFFDEMKKLIPNIQRTFEDLVDFNSKLFENKIEYFNNLSHELQKEIENLNDKKNVLVSTNRDLISLVESDNLDEYNDLEEKLLAINNQIGQQTKSLKSLTAFNEEIQNLEKKLKQLTDKNDSESSYQEKMQVFNSHFSSLARLISNDDAILAYHLGNSFPVSIENTIDGTSTGTRKALIAAFDLAYQEFAHDIKKKVPNFVVHDIIENIEGPSFKAIIDSANEIGSQFIVAVLKEKLDSSGIPELEQQEYKIVELSVEDRLFQTKNSK
ncbi:hypothetical protein [Leuconostoc falkenbergense]|uniref:hypothetical protein n=1 Tax=Leuconostoc falkenbergense TaxID=2766470 RepID=UPI0021A5DC11|nr:hypothetical protein [Leuconostoc falkenbergense]MCT4389014.1 DUF2326 domain-containing protein [Leuconostoc falkenbergense]